MGGSSPTSQTTTTDTSGKTKSATNASQTGATTGQADVSIPDWLQSFAYGLPGAATSALTGLQGDISNYQIPPESLAGLQSTAAGDYLYGGPAQQAFIDAAGRAAAPGIISTFEGSGRGTGGLAEVAMNQAYTDAFAKLFNDERNRQLQAQQILPGITALPIGMQQQLLSSIGGLPGSFAPFFGQTSAGTTTGTQTSKTKGTQTGTQAVTQPLYQPPWWQVPLGLASTVGGLAMPGLGGASAGGNIISGVKGLLGY